MEPQLRPGGLGWPRRKYLQRESALPAEMPQGRCCWLDFREGDRTGSFSGSCGPRDDRKACVVGRAHGRRSGLLGNASCTELPVPRTASFLDARHPLLEVDSLAFIHPVACV